MIKIGDQFVLAKMTKSIILLFNEVFDASAFDKHFKNKD
jgi:hypothetical protein